MHLRMRRVARAHFECGTDPDRDRRAVRSIGAPLIKIDERTPLVALRVCEKLAAKGDRPLGIPTDGFKVEVVVAGELAVDRLHHLDRAGIGAER